MWTPTVPAWTASILTLFPDLYPGPLGASLSGRAIETGLWSLAVRDIRAFASDRHRTVDDRPAGGGAGMVLRPDIIAAAIDATLADRPDVVPIYLSPRGTPFTQQMAREVAAGPGVLLVCGRFEGLDERVIEARGLREVSIGDYVLSGGDLAAMVLIDAVVRLLPGVVGKEASILHESFEDGLLEHPHYTKPRTWEGRGIPDVLLSGDHARIAAWRRAEAERVTRERRPDLWEGRMDRIVRPK